MSGLADVEQSRQLGHRIADLACDLIEVGCAGANYEVIIVALKVQLEFWQAEAETARSTSRHLQ